jgi:uncharacterized protein (TIGR03435 family)
VAQAGDLAPEVSVTKVMRSPGGAAWRHENLTGQLTVLVFFPRVSHTTEHFASHWNKLVEQFASKVQFVLISRDDEPGVNLWLEKHPFQGWLLLDSDWDTARGWGADLAQHAFIGADGRIIGFSRDPLPNGLEIERILAGQVRKARLLTRPLPHGNKPDVPPSYTVHISSTRMDPEEGTSRCSGDDYWTALGFGIKAIIAEVYKTDESRIDFPADLDNGERYDFELLLPQEESRETMTGLIRDAIERQFQLSIVRETRSMDVYVLTATEGKSGPSLREAEPGGSIFSSHSLWRSPDGTPPTWAELRKARGPIRDMSGSGASMAILSSALEYSLDRLVIDETGLEGSYNLQVSSSGNSHEDFFEALRDQLGLEVTPGKRDVAMLAVRHK